MTIDPQELERLIVELRCGDPSGAKCDKASDMLIEICRALRTGQLVPTQPSGDVVEAVARAIMVTNGACFVKDWTTERRDNPHVALAWDQATAAITAYEAASGVAKMREAGQFLLDRLVDHENSMTSDEDAREWHGHVTPALARFRAALGEKP